MILHIIDDLLPESGGPTTVVVELARQQAIAGQAVGVVCRRAPAGSLESPSLKAAWTGLPVRFLELGEHRTLRERLALLDATLDLWKPEVLHLHCVWERIVRDAAKTARRRGLPWVLSTHGMLHRQAIEKGWWKKHAYIALFGGHLKGACEALTLNREEADFVTSHFGVIASVLPNGIDVGEYLRSRAEAFQGGFPALFGKRTILYMGRLNPIKGVDKLIAAFQIAVANGLPHDLVLVGPDGGSESELRQLAQSSGLSTRIHFTGPLFGEMKRSAFRSCEMFAHRPRFEGFGLTIAEAMASSRPIVTTRACKLDGAGESGAMLVAPDDDLGFAEALLKLAGDPQMRAELGAKAEQWAMTHYDWSRIQEFASAAYERALRHHRATAVRR